MIDAIVSDFGGVLTAPLIDAFAAWQQESGVEPGALASAMALVAKRDGAHPLHQLECGRMTEASFLSRVEYGLRQELGREVSLQGFAKQYWSALAPNKRLFEYYRELHHAGFRLALLTNNVREWEQLWRRMLPIDDIFDVVVDSAFVGMRKPEPGIYDLVLRQLELPPERCLFIDDLEANVEAARELGMQVIHFRDTEQTISALERLRGANELPAGQPARGA